MSSKPADERTRSRQSLRRNLTIGGAIVVLAAMAWLLVRDDSPRRTVPTTTPRTTSAEMSGMDMGAMDMSDDGTVELTAGQLREFNIQFSTAEIRPLTTQLRTVGLVTFDERRMAQVAPKFGGFVERLYVNFTGQQLGRGQPMLDIYSPELVAAQQEMLVARQLERTMGQSSVPGVPSRPMSLVNAARQRLRLWDMSDAQIDAVLRTGRARRTVTLYSPATGTVVEKNVVNGQTVMPGQNLYTVADLRSVWVDAELREADLANVRIGSGADIELTAYPGRSFKGRVSYFHPTVQEETRTVKARIDVANTGGVLRPGMYATVVILTPRRSALTVPRSAAINTGERSVVFVDMGSGRLMPHDVVLGMAAGDYVEVISGLEAGQRVVTSAQFLLESESNIGEVMKAMIGQTGTADMGSMSGMDSKGADTRGFRAPAKPAPPRR